MKQYKITAILAAGLMAMLATGCQKDSVVMRIGVVPFGGDSKMTMDEGVYPRFSDGDLVNINGTAYSVTGSGDNAKIKGVERSTEYKAVYPAQDFTSFDGNVATLSIPRVQVYEKVGNDQKVAVPMVAVGNNVNKLLPFKNLGALLVIQLQNTNENAQRIDSVQVECSEGLYMCGPAQVDNIAADEPYYYILDSEHSHAIMSIAGANGESMEFRVPGGTEAEPGVSEELYIAVPYFTDEIDNRFTITAFSNGVVVATNTQKNPYSGCIMVNHYSRVGFELSVDMSMPAMIDGRYSIGVYGEHYYYYLNETDYIDLYKDTIKCDFSHSRGNLQVKMNADGTIDMNSWQNAPNQWDLIDNNDRTAGSAGSGNDTVDANLSLTNGWVDLFGYGLGAHNNYGISNSTNANNYTPSSTYPFYDWGTLPSLIANEGDSNWFVLSNSEWSFLLGFSEQNNFGQRLNATNRFSGKNTMQIGSLQGSAKVAGVLGIIFLPDRWTWDGCLSTLQGTGQAGLQSSYTIDEWRVLEQAGAIFLPTQTQRYGSNYSVQANGGIYMSTDPAYPAHPIHYHAHNGQGYQYGLSVRLAHTPVIVHHSDPSHPYEPGDVVTVIPVKINNGVITFFDDSESKHARPQRRR